MAETRKARRRGSLLQSCRALRPGSAKGAKSAVNSCMLSFPLPPWIPATEGPALLKKVAQKRLPGVFPKERKKLGPQDSLGTQAKRRHGGQGECVHSLPHPRNAKPKARPCGGRDFPILIREKRMEIFCAVFWHKPFSLEKTGRVFSWKPSKKRNVGTFALAKDSPWRWGDPCRQHHLRVLPGSDIPPGLRNGKWPPLPREKR